MGTEQRLTQVGGLRRGAVRLRRGASRQAVSGRTGEAVSRGQRAVQGRQTPASVQQIGLFGDFPEQGAPLLTAREKRETKRGWGETERGKEIREMKDQPTGNTNGYFC